MFSKEYLNTLSKLNGFTDKTILKYPITTLVSPSLDVVINIDAKALGCETFETTGIYELSKLINMLALFDNPQIERSQNTLEIQTTTESAVFTLCELELLKNYDQSPEIINSLERFEVVSEFELSKDILSKFKKASSILSELNALIIKSTNSNTIVNIGFHNRFNSSSNTFKKEFLGTSTKDFDLKLGIENIQKLPQEDYKVKVFYNQERDDYRVVFVTNDFKVLISKLKNE